MIGAAGALAGAGSELRSLSVRFRRPLPIGPLPGRVCLLSTELVPDTLAVSAELKDEVRFPH